MDQIVTPDCHECSGEGQVPFDRSKPDGIHYRPCGQCCRRHDLANPVRSPKFIHMNCTMAEFTSMLREASTNLEVLWDPTQDEEVHQSSVETVQMLLRNAATFIENHDPSTKVQLTEAEAPYCNSCEFDHVPGECGL